MRWQFKSSWKRKYLFLLFVFLLIFVALHPDISTTNEPPENRPPPPTTTINHSTKDLEEEEEEDCPFRNSPLYRSIFVYPNPHFEASLFDNYCMQKKNASCTIVEWPWILQHKRIRQAPGSFVFDVDQPSLTQFSLDLVVYEIMTSSCLRTYDADSAKLYFVPFLPSVFRLGGDMKWSLDVVPHTSIYEEALATAMSGQSFEGWENHFGLTSYYWKRNEGVDHVVVMPEPLHGLYHPRGKRGFHHYIKTQKQLLAPIVISVEVSKTFVETYPQCVQKNILMPYPNIDGRWYNGYWDEQASKLQGKVQPQQQSQSTTRPLSLYYDAGNHGECLALRKALQINHECQAATTGEPRNQFLLSNGSRNSSFPLGMRMATYCPCPAGDSPSAKRMFDAVLAGCIPVILSQDFVWPFSTETTTSNHYTGEEGGRLLDPNDFALHLDASQFSLPLYQRSTTNGTCRRIATSNKNDEETLQEFLHRTISSEQIARLQGGLRIAADAYSIFDPQQAGVAAGGASSLKNPLSEGILPLGGALKRLVDELAERASTGSQQWKKCQEEKAKVLQQTRGKMVKENKC